MKMREEFLTLTKKLLNSSAEPGLLTPITNRMAEILGEVTKISTEEDMSGWQDVRLASGVAISPVQAAKCLKEPIRTQVFLKGVYKAINDKLQKQNVVKIVYAGTGPYGSILLPLLPLLEPHAVKVEVIDIHPENIKALERVIEWLGVEEYIDATFVADACRWKPEYETQSKFDLIVSETMNAFLEREPQVSIFAHLAQFLKVDGELIPQQICVQAWLIGSGGSGENNDVSSTSKIKKLSDLFNLNLAIANEIREKQLTCIKKQFSLPDDMSYFATLQLQTDIQVYGQHRLSLKQSSLNAIKKIKHGAIKPGSGVDCTYQISDEPSWYFNVADYFKEKPLRPSHDQGQLGILHLPRYWDKYRRLPFVKGCELPENEWLLDHLLLQLLGVGHDESIEFLLINNPQLREFEQWLSSHAKFPGKDLIAKYNQQMIVDVL